MIVGDDDQPASDPASGQQGLRSPQAPARTGNLFDRLPAARDAEVFTTLLQRAGLRIERIVSHGQASAPDFWYDCPDEEWVVLLRGGAAVWIEGEPAPRVLGVGDWLHLPAHCRHRLHWTDPAQHTVWLAVHSEPADRAHTANTADKGEAPPVG
ncbi:cupin 2 domain-containing protein [Cupriavidus gilardii J11]|uniref:Cupin 2 domain-containing protein n=1 Tax=Cupriavidus gilardii J11 TaxID=936133 RepID=A0A562BDW0_9BURK|nr:cupin domain-containing protein [Cupriavidus gilardii]TWG83336.1 cupin 2 domain-containing protein [Cupriavidus gilardii J11]